MERLFRPRSIAVIGGGLWAQNIVRECRRIGFQGDVWPVHPTQTEVAGLPAFPTVSALPGVLDAAYIAVNREATISVMRELSTIGAGGAVCLAAGFREAAAELDDGADLQDALIAAAGEMPFLGPNCYGIINALDGAALWPDQHGMVRVESGVAIVTQSSNIAINVTMQRRGLPIAYAVTAGNQARVSLSQIGREVLRDPRVTALGLHIEGIGDLDDFQQLAEFALEIGKPVVALKVGASDQAQAATVSHTASLAGSDAASRALLKRLGVIQVDSLAVMVETLKLLHVAGRLPSNRIASLSCSGGEASLMADGGLAAGVEFPALNTRQKAGLREVLGPKVALSNPLDYHTYIWGNRQALTATFRATVDPSLAMVCVVLDYPRLDRCTAKEWQDVLDALQDTQDLGVPLGLIASLPENMPEDIAEDCVRRGITPFNGMPEALAAIAAAAQPVPVHRERVWSPGGEPKGLQTLAEGEAKAALAVHGLCTPRTQRVVTANEAAKAAEAMGFPVVLKGEGFAHKTEAGAVALNLISGEQVFAAAERMGARSYLVEQMIGGVVTELLVGVTRDQVHGYLLTLGAGGVMTEVWKDSTNLLLPVTGDDIREALTRLRIWQVLQGWRGAPGADLDAIVAQVLAVQDYVRATPGLSEVEINPLLCLPDGAVAVDALIRKGEP
ncbi:acetate--CoA ligase family protein [Paracoccus sulfuroxidans]|uniref:Acyl-CoA synthetase (NDP forming) n=1 Tax=Paracoccus sulfuroxidans TaxID=384678 RepID=A0A562NHQ0_9RHOB|nr:acetate--CoA ligase family protein [Paracoccus sulfuroxidans]TWI31451.1 acyl-CoA synthetase (NDP forming) [Paracoccus sulfuroxidans]